MLWIIGIAIVIYIAVKFLNREQSSQSSIQTVNHPYARMFWGGWSREIHYLHEQRDIAEKRFDINPDTCDVDVNTKTARIGKFKTSLISCTCKQFLTRRLPCKHIYYLADDLEYAFPENDQYYGQINHEDFESWIRQNVNFEYKKYIDDQDPPSYWGGWSPTIHAIPQQQDRICRMESNPEYNTTLHYCTCMDYRKRRLPCKHIYKMAFGLKLPL